MANFMLFTKEEVKKFKNIGNPNKFILLKSNNTSDSAKILSKFAEDYIYVNDIFKDFVKKSILYSFDKSSHNFFI